mgnify:CR=1 FL=1
MCSCLGSCVFGLSSARCAGGSPDNRYNRSSKYTAKDGNNISGNANDTLALMPYERLVSKVWTVLDVLPGCSGKGVECWTFCQVALV